MASLTDKYTRSDGRALMTGIQALVRLTLEQRRLDEERGLDTRVFVSGYRGSPLGGVDVEFERAAHLLEPAGVVFKAGLNEELAATAVAGTQLLARVPGRRHEAVTGFWYGKNPGLDRAADALRHGMLAGTDPLGGAVAWIGDDPACKSSTVPSSCEQMCQSLSMPLLAPGTVGEVIELGLHAVAMSRASGLWVGLKMLTDVADGSATVDLAGLGAGIPLPDRDRALSPGSGAAAVEAEYDMRTRRLGLALAYGRAAGLNRVVSDPEGATLGIVAPGGAFPVVLRALADLGLDAEPYRLIKLSMPFPLSDEELVELTADLTRVLVVEDKVSFVEARLKEALYRRPGAPEVIGRELLTARGTLGADDVARALTVLTGRAAPAPASQPLVRRSLPLVAARAPFFCSGCPHNISTRTDDTTLVGVGIGCHSMVALDGKGRGTQIGLTQMGGEGAQWFGIAPFTDDRHFVQNLGDGTFHHSGSLAIRAAVDAGVTMTYKLLYNDAVAMTGGQRVEGRLDVPALTRWLALEGVTKVVITTPEPGAYRGVRLDPIATVRHRDDFAEAERELAALSGVTVLIHDDRCAAEERRLRKRGRLPAPKERVAINERVCEGCGDCAEKSTCLSVHPTANGKTRIHQPSCNSDLSCLKGDCPSFLLVTPGRRKKKELPVVPADLPDPVRRFADVLIRMPGIGGTGVVTASQILQMAAALDGLHAAGVDQTGLAQKGGPVISDVRISAKPITGAVRASQRSVDVLLAFDLIGAAGEVNLSTARPGHTVAVVNTALVPTLGMVTHRAPLPASPADALERIESVAETFRLDALGLAEKLFGDHMPANMILVGAAFQYGCLPLTADAIEEAIRLNGAAVETNLAAFRSGRACVVSPPAAEEVKPAEPLGMAAWIDDLTGYQSPAYARRFAEAVSRAEAAVEGKVDSETATEIVTAYARNLHRLMAYKDEYEVARLHLDPTERARVVAEHGPGAKVAVLLHPPVLRALGMKRKIRLRRTAGPLFRVLRAARRLRGTPFDVFGFTRVRRVERELIEEYRLLMTNAFAHLAPDTATQVLAIAELPERIRGYEEIKLARVAEFREEAARALAQLEEIRMVCG
ncbi:indolepyruvate ferredoxin oxidoreductase family protein [Thermopolyspora sp. NPDC052614]|uniref:indolepyruvate ferredoxin oxidoreductase family protein n=1 Tax=Thermopolyspora sp. NPDC052614 TaxID=3155682 RepID=UPI0034134F06